MKVYLYRVGRNLNRVIRTCEAFGVSDLCLLDCGGEIKGNLYGAEGRVYVQKIDRFPSPQGLLAIETWCETPLWDVDFCSIHGIIVGGETVGLPRKIVADYKAVIPMFGKISGLTVEAALATALYEWRRGRR